MRADPPAHSKPRPASVFLQLDGAKAGAPHTGGSPMKALKSTRLGLLNRQLGSEVRQKREQIRWMVDVGCGFGGKESEGPTYGDL